MNSKLLLSLPLLAAPAVAFGPADDGTCSGSKTQVAAWTVQDDHEANIVETAVANGNFKTLAAALKAADLVDALSGKGPFTVFAPTDAAFAKLPKGTLETLLAPENKAQLTAILTYHVASGEFAAKDVAKRDFATTLNGQRIDIRVSDEGVMIDGARVTTADIQTSNGIIHVIDTVILPSTDDIIETAVQAGTFKTLATAVKTAGLVETLKGKGPFTVFAPTDEAFAKLPAGTVESLLKPENRKQLQDILTYHVVAGRVFAEDAVNARRATTLQGSEVRARIVDGRLYINDAAVLGTDIEATNGVIHVLDTVLMP